MCMLYFRHEYPRARFIVLVPTLTLIDQWFVSLHEEIGIPKDEIACFSSQEKASQPKVVNLLVLNTARKLVSQIADEKDVFLVVDEVHRAGSPANALALKIQPKAALGLSATPEREYDNGFETHIVPALGDIIYRYDYTQAYSDGVITPFELLNVKVQFLPDEAERYRALSQRAALEMRHLGHQRSSEERLKRLLQVRATVSATAATRIPVAAKLVEIHRGKRTIVFHERVSAGNTILGILNKREHLATIYHSKIGPAIRRDNLRLYRKGIFDVLVTCRALDEGMNVPETTVAIIASSTASHRQRIQRLGRVLRPALGKKNAMIYTIYATSQEARRLRQEERDLLGIISISWLRGFKIKNG